MTEFTEGYIETTYTAPDNASPVLTMGMWMDNVLQNTNSGFKCLEGGVTHFTVP